MAPMAGFTDAACRHLMADHGAAYTVSEMGSSRAIVYKDAKTLELLRDDAPHGIYAVQLFGEVPELLGQAAANLLQKGLRFDLLDLNMGCPAPKIVSGGAGSRLMLDPPLCGNIVRAVRDAVGDAVPVTVKMRLGWDDAHRTAVEVARQCEAAGAALIAVHGRTREQMYLPPVDIDGIREVCRAVTIPVLANGDVASAQDALDMMERTGAAGVMVGRAALGNPWLFEQIRAALAGQPAPPLPTMTQRMAALRRQVYEMCENKGENVAMPQARGQAMHYMAGLRGAAQLRQTCSSLTYFSDVDRLIDLALRLQRTDAPDL